MTRGGQKLEDILLLGHYFTTVVQLLNIYYNPKPPEVSLASYVAALRDLALHCEYGDELSEMLLGPKNTHKVVRNHR